MLLLAETWGMAPWQIEAEAPAVWVQRWEALQVARNAAMPRPPKGRGRELL